MARETHRVSVHVAQTLLLTQKEALLHRKIKAIIILNIPNRNHIIRTTDYARDIAFFGQFFSFQIACIISLNHEYNIILDLRIINQHNYYNYTWVYGMRNGTSLLQPN